MDISVYELFLVVADTQSITRASERLHITQPAAWKKLASLEKSLGIALFSREGKRMELTPAGRVLYDYASRIVSLHQEGIRSAIKENDFVAQFLRIGASVSLSSHLLPVTIKRLQQTFPSSQYLIKTGHSFQIEEMISDQLIDLAFMRYSISLPGWTVQELARDPVILIVPPHNPLASVKNSSVEEVIRYPVIVYDPTSLLWNKVTAFFQERGLSFQSFIQTDSSESVKRMVAQGLGIGFLTWSVVREDVLEKRVATVRVEGRPFLLERPLYLISRKSEQRPLAHHFINLVKEELVRWHSQFLEILGNA